MAALYDRARLVVVPSRWPEPFGMVGVEAMRRARPVVGARHGGIPEWLADTVTGWMFEPCTHRDLARVLQRAVKSPHYAETAARARESATTRFSFAGMLDQLETVIAHSVSCA